MKSIVKKIQTSTISYRTYFILLAIFGIIMTFMIPTWQTPDEFTHLQTISSALGNEYISEAFVEDMQLDIHRILGNQDEKIDREQWKRALTAEPTYEVADVMPKEIRFSVVQHLPAVVGIVLGVQLRLPTFWVMELAEICSLMLYLLICIQAIKIMPFKKEIMMIFMTFPMSIQQASSINYDSIVIPLCFYITAYILHLAYDVKEVRWKQVFTVLAVLAILMYIKLPYILFGLLVFMIPRNKIRLSIGPKEINGKVIKKYRWLVLILLIALVAIVGYVFRDNKWISLLTGLALEPQRTLYLLYSTGRNFFRYVMVSSVGNLAWLDTPMPMWFVLATYLLLVLLVVKRHVQSGSKKMGMYQSIVVWATFIILTVFIVFSMVNHTIMMVLYGWEWADATYDIREALYAIPYIGGIQGRYFLPFIPLPFLATGRRNGTIEEIQLRTKTQSNKIVVLYVVFTIILTTIILYQRFWRI